MIGVFDSGHGGLTVLRALTARFPDQEFTYFGDHAYAPYGMRSTEEIYQLTRRRVAFLIDRGCRLVVLACNTASAVALRRLQQEWLPVHAPDARILGVFIPVIEALSGQEWSVAGPSRLSPRRIAKTVGVFATRKTVESGAFRTELQERVRGIKVIQQGCPRLAESIEKALDPDLLKGGVRRYCEQMLAKAGRTPIELVVLGCTHYPLVRDYFEAALPPKTPIMDQPSIIADSLARYLDRHPEFRTPVPVPAQVTYLTSGDPAIVTSTAAGLFGEAISFRYFRDDTEPAAEQEPGPTGQSEEMEEETQ